MTLLLQGRPDMSAAWGTVDVLKEANDAAGAPKDQQDRAMEGARAKLHQWNNHAVDGKGAFTGWQFRLSGSIDAKAPKAKKNGR